MEVDPLSKRQIAFSPTYQKVPICVLNGQQVNDSSVILQHLDALIPSDHPLKTASSPAQEQWLAWVDSYFVHLLPANIYRSPKEAMQSFDYLLDSSFNFSAIERTLARYSGALIMYLLCRFKLNKKYGIVNPREEIYTAVNQYCDALQGTSGGGRACHNVPLRA